MRRGRIKVSSEGGEAVYHCISRVVNGERVMDAGAREVLRKQLWQTAEYCGVQIQTYAILSNHFHVLVRVPQKRALSDEELLRRYRLLHTKPTRYQTQRLEVIEAWLKQGNREGEVWREGQREQMNDVSWFMKLVKQRFTIWYNKTHGRYGTLWAERFKSVLIEPRHHAIQTVALYIDLNPLRAGLVKDPKDYRYSGYGEAVAGGRQAREGLQSVYGENWEQTQSAHRQGLYGKAVETRQNAAAISERDFETVLKQKGRLSLSEVLRCRVRYFTDGAVLGSRAFVEKHLEDYRKRYGVKRVTPRELEAVTDWKGLMTLRSLRRNVFG